MTREEQIYKKAEGDCIAMLESIERGDIIKGSICPQSYRAGFMDGARWAGQHPNWIPVEERLPEDDGGFSDEVFVYGRMGYSVARYSYISNCWSFTEFLDDEITHWMKPIEPRKEE